MKTDQKPRSKYPPPSINEQMRRRFHEAQERARLEHEALCALHNDDFDDCAWREGGQKSSWADHHKTGGCGEETYDDEETHQIKEL